MKYIDLHIHTIYTKGNSTTTINNLVQKAKEYSMPMLSITDSASIDGFKEFEEITKANDISPIFGIGFYFSDNRYNENATEKYHIVLIAKNDNGLKNLITLQNISEESDTARKQIDLDLLRKYHDGLILLTGGTGGIIDKFIFRNDYAIAKDWALKFKEIFTDDFYIELQDNETDKNKVSLDKLPPFAKELNIKTIFSGGSFYMNRKDAEECNQIREKNGNNKLNGNGYFFKSIDDILKTFNDKDSIQRSYKIAQSCTYNRSVTEVIEEVYA